MYVRPAVAADAVRVAQVVRSAAIEGYAGLFPPGSAPPPIEQFVAGWQERIADPTCRVIVAVADDDVCGVAALARDDGVPSGRLLERLYVEPGTWTGGAGSALHDAAVRAALLDGADGLHLWVLEGNARARGMYERRGWRVVPGRTATPEGADAVELLYELGLPAPTLFTGRTAEISIARAADAGEILTLQRAAFLRDAQIYDDPFMASLTQPLDEIRSIIAADDWLVLVARLGFRVVGSVRAHLVDGVADIGRLMSAPDAEGRGIGRALMSALETMAAPLVGRFRLHTGVRSHDTIDFYERLGYALVADPTVPPDAVTMTKTA